MALVHTSEEALDLALASELQAALLPKECPAACERQVAAARNRMCSSVGGDFYDFLRINDEQIALAIGDVVGHGIRASLLMAQIMGYLRFGQGARNRPSAMVKALNRMLIDLGDKTGTVTPCSLFYGVIDVPSGEGMFVNAGHPRPLLLDQKTRRLHRLAAHNFVLGIEDFEPNEICLTFTSSQRLMMYTDGILDAADRRDDHFGEHRLHELILSTAGDSAATAADTIFAAVADFRNGCDQLDDETLVIVDRL